MSAGGIRAVDVQIGDFYRVRSDPGELVVEIIERIQSCCWLCRNTVTGADRCVLHADLIAKVDALPQPAIGASAPESSRQRTGFDKSLNERMRRATGAS